MNRPRINVTSAKKTPEPTRTSVRSIPLYQQVEQYLRERISNGSLRTGDMLPSVKELCEQFGGINHLTVRQAIKNLSKDGLVRSIQGRGSFITERATYHARVAILLPHLEDVAFIRIAQGAQEILESSRVSSLILDSRGSQTNEANHIHSLKNLPVNGAIIFPIAYSQISEQIFKLKMEQFSFVLVGSYLSDIATFSVVTDNYQGGYKSGQHLAAQGRRRVAWIGQTSSRPAQLHLKGFQDALNDANVACPKSLIKEVGITTNQSSPHPMNLKAEVSRAVEELLTQTTSVDGVVCSEDTIALNVLAQLKYLGKRIPEDIALIGFDDTPEAASSQPGLTTLRRPVLDMGRAASDLLIEQMENREFHPQQRILPVELILRGTA